MNCLEISGLHLLLSLPTLRVYNSTYFRRLFQAEKDFLKFNLDLLPLNSASYAAKLCPDWKKISKECVLSLKGKESASRSDSNSVVGCLEATNALLESVWRVLSIVRDITDAKVWIFSMCQSVVLLCIR
jgi:hypothetical protein